MPNPEELAFFLRNVVKNPKYEARDGLTFCNHLVQDVFKYFGYEGFEGLLANQIYDLCAKSDEFEEQQPEECAWLVKQYGYLVVAAKKGKKHGHVAVVFPGIPAYSAKWDTRVPIVASTGKENSVNGANWFFKDMPKFFKLKELYYPS